MYHWFAPSPPAVNKAYKMFDDEEQVQYCMGVAEEAREMLQAKLDEKRKLAKKEGKTTIEEDDPTKVCSSGQVTTPIHVITYVTLFPVQAAVSQCHDKAVCRLRAEEAKDGGHGEQGEKETKR